MEKLELLLCCFVAVYVNLLLSPGDRRCGRGVGSSRRGSEYYVALLLLCCSEIPASRNFLALRFFLFGRIGVGIEGRLMLVIIEVG